MAKGWGDIKPITSTKWQDLLDWYKWRESRSGEDEFNHIRLIGPIKSACYHWIEVRKNDGTKTSFPMTCAGFPMTCVGYNPETETTDIEKCPACQIKISQQKFYFQNAIIRREQEIKPARAIELEDCPEEMAKEYRAIGDKHWSPVKVVKIPVTCAAQLRDIVGLNKHRVEDKVRSMDISDIQYGCDIFVKYDSKESPSSMYNVQKGDAAPLTEEEKKYKLFNLNVVKTDVEKMRNDLIRFGRLKAKSTTPGKSDLHIEEDDELPPPPTSEYVGEEEEKEKARPKDKLDSLNRAQLEHLNTKRDWCIDTEELDDDELRNIIRSILKNKCFGDYLAEDKCFKCKARSSCVEKSE